ncbi:MAG TPA: class I SAM-dependent methyltransferase [Chthoniobacter sp.]|nr:class I SAM-dependent methyltransferase [Chthoniobacter sp.]
MTEPTTGTHDDWDTHWDQYADAARENPAQRMRHAIISALLTASAKGRQAHVFDIGSGQGDMVELLSATLPDAQFLGAELSESGVEISKRKTPKATFLVADLFEPPAILQPFTGWATHAVCSEVLEHVDDPAAFLRQARPYLADGAQLIVTVPGGLMSAFDKHIGHRQHFTRESISHVLQKAGFEVERVCLAGFPFFNLYRMTVITRGEKLIGEVKTGAAGGGSALAKFVMGVFRFLFRFNLLATPFGWQVVAVARKASA